jgi:hypothetical protein
MGEGGEEEEACVVIYVQCTYHMALYALPLMLRGCTALKARAKKMSPDSQLETWGCWVE